MSTPSVDAGGDQKVMINQLVDFILQNVWHNRRTLECYRVVNIPDLVKRMEADLQFLSFTASLTANEGTLSDLTTLRRVGDASLRSQGSTLFVSATVVIDLLEVVFRDYTIQAAVFKKSGDKLQLKVKKNSFNLLLVLRFDGLECFISLEKFAVLEFSDVDVDLTGFSMLNSIGGKVAEWVIDFFNDFIKDVVSTYAKHMVNYAVSDKDMVQRLLGYMISGVVRGANSSSESSQSSTNSTSLQTTEVKPAIEINPDSSNVITRNVQSRTIPQRKERISKYSPMCSRTPVTLVNINPLRRVSDQPRPSEREEVRHTHNLVFSNRHIRTVRNVINRSTSRNALLYPTNNLTAARPSEITLPNNLGSSRSAGLTQANNINTVRPTIFAELNEMATPKPPTRHKNLNSVSFKGI